MGGTTLGDLGLPGFLLCWCAAQRTHLQGCRQRSHNRDRCLLVVRCCPGVLQNPRAFIELIRVKHWAKKSFRLLVIIPLIIFANSVEARLLTA